MGKTVLEMGIGIAAALFVWRSIVRPSVPSIVGSKSSL
jgi:hypothetical protein